MKQVKLFYFFCIVLATAILYFSCQKKGCDCPNSPPSFPTNSAALASPGNNSLITNRCPNLNWRSASDPEGEKITYNIYFSTDTFKLVLLDSNLTTNYYVPCDLKPSTKYFWKIIAFDIYKNSDTSEVWSFITAP